MPDVDVSWLAGGPRAQRKPLVSYVRQNKHLIGLEKERVNGGSSKSANKTTLLGVLSMRGSVSREDVDDVEIERYFNPEESDSMDSGIMQLRTIMNALEECNRYAYGLEPIQTHIVTSIVHGVIPRIFDINQMIRHIRTLIVEFKVSIFKDAIHIELPRRGGKTIAVSTGMVILLLGLRGRHVYVFSPTQRTSTEFLDTVESILDSIISKSRYFVGARKIQKSTKTMKVQTSSGHKNKITALPGTPTIGA